jgi:cytochrome c-type biogenesis protein CcsB
VEIIRYFENSTVRAADSGEVNEATRGTGLEFVAEEAPPGGSTQRQIDLASAYVTVVDRKTGQDLCTLLLSQHFPSRRMLANSVTVGNQTYGLELRFKRSQKPYQITLLDVRKDDYVGTNMPRNYSSRVRLEDASRGVEFDTKIWMNNPLRYAGETFYQSGYNRGPAGETSTLQVVKNTGWMIPYVSCMIVATGMLAHFVLLLFRFLRRGSEDGGPGEMTENDGHNTQRAAPAQRNKLPIAVRWFVPLAAILLAATYVMNKALPRTPSPNQMNLVAFGEIPLMYEGRVKPMETLARNSLRIVSNRETFVDGQGNKQPAVRWLLDVIARPEVAERHRVFRIDNLDVLKSLGLERRKGFRYSWRELRERSREFQQLAMDARQQDAQARTLPQRKIIQLLQRVERYRLLTDAVRPLPLPPFPSEQEIAQQPEAASRRVAAITRATRGIPANSQQLAARHPPLLVPVDSADQPWQAYATAKNESYVAQHFQQQEPPPAVEKLSAIFEAYATDRAYEFNDAVAGYQQFLTGQSHPGLDPQMAGFEAFFMRFAPFYHTIPLYVFALLLTVAGWLATVGWPRAAELFRSTSFWLVVLAFAVHTFALAARVAISGRPPVTNLYSSAVFVGWGCVGIGLLLELVSRLGIGNLVAAVSGIGTLIVAHFLAADGDTIRVLQAVLDTQFWLTVHVLTVTLGYSATFLAGLLGIFLVLYLLAKPLVLKLGTVAGRTAGEPRPADLSSEGQVDATKVLGGMIYGTICFAALFSLVGTVLGGLWADDSWGRFWGWDPKENGALMVVLWNALVLHARSAHVVKERGLAVLAIGGNIITAWSWFGVNELGVGLHSYGFTEGVSRALWIFWLSQILLIGAGTLPYLVERVAGRRSGGAALRSSVAARPNV